MNAKHFYFSYNLFFVVLFCARPLGGQIVTYLLGNGNLILFSLEIYCKRFNENTWKFIKKKKNPEIIFIKIGYDHKNPFKIQKYVQQSIVFLFTTLWHMFWAHSVHCTQCDQLEKIFKCIQIILYWSSIIWNIINL